jgi:hypothetical protein
MLKSLAILAVLLTITQTPTPISGQAANQSSAGSQKQNDGGNSGKNSAKATSQVVAEKPTNRNDKTESEKGPYTDSHSTLNVSEPVPIPEVWRWYDIVAWVGNLLLVGVGIGTLIAVWKQAKRMKEHAEELKNVAAAALLNAQAVIGSERAWLTATMGEVKLEPEPADPNIQVTFWMHPTVANHGRTPARLTKMYLRYRLCKSITELPFVPVYEVEDDDPSEDGSSCFDGELLIVPNSGLSPLGVPLDGEDARTVRAGDITLILYGYIRYEINGVPGETTRFTRFIFRYDLAGKSSPIPEGFHFPTGLPEYNRAT